MVSNMANQKTKPNKTETLLYGLLKLAARSDFVEFLDNWELTLEDFDEIKAEMVDKLEINGANIYL